MVKFATWSRWRPFPDPRRGEDLVAPIGAGCYDLRLRSTGERILFGTGAHLAERMTSLLPAPFGKGTRNNSGKRQCVLDEIADMEYQTITFATKAEAQAFERTLRGLGYRFPDLISPLHHTRRPACRRHPRRPCRHPSLAGPRPRAHERRRNG